jgi:hypothetical protein
VPRNPSVKQPADVVTESLRNIEDEIRCRAYELYEARGREDGYDVDDWLRAEAELRATTLRAAA